MVTGRLRKQDIVPEDWVDYVLMDHFKCLPSELDKEDNAKLIKFLKIRAMIAGAENKLINKNGRK